MKGFCYVRDILGLDSDSDEFEKYGRDDSSSHEDEEEDGEDGALRQQKKKSTKKSTNEVRFVRAASVNVSSSNRKVQFK